MANKKTGTNIKDERIEDVTMYGEFISSFDQWQTPERQKKVAKRLEEVTSKGNQKNKATVDEKSGK